MKRSLLIAALAVALASCNNTKSNETNEAAENNDAAEVENTMSLVGEWRLNDYAGETEMAEMDSTTNYVLTITDEGTFGMSTDCNSLGGEYKTVGDSIKFDNIAMTQMACPDEKVERAMSTILPMIDTYAITPDSVLLLRSDMRTMARFSYVK